MKAPTRYPRSPGFALVVTLSLMMLLTVLAIGLLSLSSISLRAASQGEAMASARANARLALMLALGELQRTAGPDQRVTARADILGESEANPQFTGVWESKQIKATEPPTASDYDKDAKAAQFRGWLVSNIDVEAARQSSFASKPLTSPVTLWGTGTLGTNALAQEKVNASKVPLISSPGALAWAVLDEGIKVRINTPYIDGATSSGAKTAQLGTGERPGVEFIDGLAGLDRKMFEKTEKESANFAKIEKGIDRLNYSLAAESIAPGMREALQLAIHDVTTHSLGLFTNTARGGLKQDLQLIMNAPELPKIYKDKPGVYESLLGMKPSAAPSDPKWASFHQFSRLYRDPVKDTYPENVTSTSGVPTLKMQTPTDWKAAETSGDPQTTQITTINRTPPSGLLLLPTIAKVQMLFSLIGRDLYGNLPDYIQRELTVEEKSNRIHGPQCNNWAGTKYNYDLHILYTPIVTLHNPYNVAIDCENLRVEFVHVPLSMKIFRKSTEDADFVAQSTDMVPFQTMTADNQGGARGKIFGMNLKNKTSDGKVGDPTFRMLPGEVKVFSPYLDPDRTYLQDLGDRKFWDIYLNTALTTNMDAIPGWRGDGVGFSCDWICGNKIINEDFAKGRWGGCMGIAWNDEIYVEFIPFTSFPPTLAEKEKNKFIVQMSVQKGTSARTIVSAVEMDYESPHGLEQYFTSTGLTMPMRYPASGSIQGVDLVDRAKVPIKELKFPKPFALIGMQAKTTAGARDSSKEDGRLGTKPWCFAHANIGASTQKVLSEHPANQSHEIDLQLLKVKDGTSQLVQIDPMDRGNFISGHSARYGTKFGLQYDIPLAPLQNFASLNGANPGGCTVLPPRFAQPIGNSWAHPLISLGKLSETKPAGNCLDHSFLLNLAFYDNFYFSGLADQTGPFGTSSKSATSLAADFAAGKPLDDPRVILHHPNSRPASDFAGVLKKDDAYSQVAAWQLMQGAFNINSTSVLAWKAMLASIHDSQALVNQLIKIGSPPTSKLTTLTAVGKQESRISRFRLPVSVSSADGGEIKDGYWLGPREYSTAQLQKLAENIVKQVRLRGPFLSMAEFVNRRLGSGDTAQRGALQQAIDEANVNRDPALKAEAGFEIPIASVETYKYVNKAAGAGSSYQGAPGFLSQADILNVLGKAATPRSDTFTIRGYGEARDAAGKILASAVCEAVVQRFPEWVDTADKVETAVADLTSDSNKRFGRRFQITSLRWLNSTEI
jgi:hypothetical protein